MLHFGCERAKEGDTVSLAKYEKENPISLERRECFGENRMSRSGGDDRSKAVKCCRDGMRTTRLCRRACLARS
jgi:hypothetical protein